MPARAAYRKKVSRLAPPKFRERRNDRGTMGEAERASTIRKPASAATPSTAASLTAGPPRGASIRAKVIAPRPRVASIAPGQSSLRLADSLRLSGTRHNVMHITANAMGRLMKKIQRQEACSTIQPPRTGPSAAVIEVKPDHVPMARPRSLSEKEALSSARLPGTSNAAPAPCTPRAAIKKEIEGASPHKADPTAKRSTPIMKIFARP